MDDSHGNEKRKAAATVVNGTRVTVAFPFSTNSAARAE